MHGIKMDMYRKPIPVSEKTLELASIETEKILKAKQKKHGKR